MKVLTVRTFVCGVLRGLPGLVAMAGGILAAWSTLALAQPAAEDGAAALAKTKAADALFLEGKELMAAGRIADGCARFARSQAIEPKVTTLVNHANCREKNGQLASAAQLFAEVAAQLRTVSDESGAALRQLSLARVATLQPRLSTLTLRVSAQQQGVVLWRDRLEVEASQWNRALPIDGGVYTLSAKAPGYQRWTMMVTVAGEGDAVVVEVPRLQADAEAAAPTAVAAPVESRAPAGSRARPVTGGRAGAAGGGARAPAGSRARPVTVGLAVAAVVLAGTAIGFEVSARAQYDESVQLSKDMLIARSEDLYDSANRRRYIAQGLGVAAIGCAGAAIYLYLSRGRREPAAAARSSHQVAPLLAASIAGVQWRYRYLY